MTIEVCRLKQLLQLKTEHEAKLLTHSELTHNKIDKLLLRGIYYS